MTMGIMWTDENEAKYLLETRELRGARVLWNTSGSS